MQLSIQLYHGDNTDIMRTWEGESFDTIITDPPYASGGLTSAARKADPCRKYHSSGTKKQYPSFANDTRDQRSHYLWSLEWMREACRLTRPGGWMMCFSDWRQLPLTSDALQVAGWIWRGILVWDKTEATRPQLGQPRNQAEYVLYATKGDRDKDVRTCPAGVYRTRLRPGDKLHVTGKPVDLMEHLMTVLPPGSRILDPFAGSGTTLMAAQSSGHTATGIELSSEYYAIAAERLGLASSAA